MIDVLHDTSFSLDDITQSVCRESLYDFVKEAWHVLVPEEPVWNWHIEYVCDELQKLAKKVFNRQPKEHDLIINIPPGTTKSTICSVMFPAWLWTRQPELRVITGSYDALLALSFAVKSRDLMMSDWYQSTFRFKKNARGLWRPSTDADAVPISLKEDQNTKGLYENMAMGSRKAVGVGGSVTGSHAHVILVDDPINPKAAGAVSEADLKEVNRWMNETLPSRKVDKAMTPTVLIMQRLHQNDPSGNWLEKKNRLKLRHICLPAEARAGTIKPAKLVLHYVDGLLDPIRLGREVLDEAKQDLGEFGFAGQFDQNPIPRGGGMFKVDMIQMETPPELEMFIQIVRYWDKAGTKDAGANTAGVKMGIDKWKRIWILDVIKGQWRPDERERTIRQAAQADGFSVVVYIEQEPGSGGKESAETTIIDTLPEFRVRLDRPTGDKATRAEPFAGKVNIGRVYIPKGAKWWPDYRDELRYFPASTRKDQVDASSGAYIKIAGAKIRAGSAV